MDRPARFDAFEAGASSGRLAADILRYARTAEPDFYDAVRYVVQDVTLSGAEAQARLEASGVPAGHVEVAASLPQQPSIEGAILSNELLDALPFRRVRRRDGHLYELLVGAEDGRFVDVEAEPRPEVIAHFDALGVSPGEGCEAEVSLVAPAWMARAAGALKRGYVLTLDYGYEAPELYASWRKRGTLLTFYRHTSGDDPYARIGRQDITASVDFTSVRRAGEAAGLTPREHDDAVGVSRRPRHRRGPIEPPGARTNGGIHRPAARRHGANRHIRPGTHHRHGDGEEPHPLTPLRRTERGTGTCVCVPT